jgi:hypothetical protein
VISLGFEHETALGLLLLSNSTDLRPFTDNSIISDQPINYRSCSILDVGARSPKSHPARKSPDTLAPLYPTMTIYGCKKLILQDITTISSDIASHERKTVRTVLKDAPLNGRLDYPIQVLICPVVQLQVSQILT